MPGGSTVRQCPHCLQKINCANRRCTKCGKLLDIKSRQTARMKLFRTRAKEWAQKVKKSRNQAKIFDNSALLVEKLKALGYFPLLLWGKYRQQNRKWTAQLQCPFELPVVAHAVLEKILCLFEGLLEACDPQSEEVVQQERPGENDTEREINNEDQRGQEEQHEIDIEDQRGQEEQNEIDIEDQRGQEEQNEIDIEDQRGQEEQHEIDIEDQRGQEEQREIGETEMTDMQEMEIEAQAHEDRVESKREERGEMEGQKDYDELRLMGTEVMNADNEREKTEEVGNKETKAKKKEVAANRKSAVQISSKKKGNRRRRNKDDDQGCPTLFLEGYRPADFSSNPNQTQLKQLIKLASITAHWTFFRSSMYPRHVKKRAVKKYWSIGSRVRRAKRSGPHLGSRRRT